MPLLLILSCRIQHVFDENTVPGVRGIDEHMGHRANEFPILNNRTSAHE